MAKTISKHQFVLISMVVLYGLMIYFFIYILDYDFFRSDVFLYWQESLNWQVPYNEHPPLYTLTIALARGITFSTLPPVGLMMGINLLTFGFSIGLIMQFSRLAGTSQRIAALAAAVFGLWPFVGLTYTVIPVADIPSIVLTLAGFIFLQKSRHPLAAIVFGAAIITHKGVWPVIGLVALADFYMRREFFSKQNFIFVFITLFPLAVLWIAGMLYHGSINWFIERSLRVNTSIVGGYPILDGVLGTFQEGGTKGLVKGIVVLFMLGLSVVTLVSSFKLKFKYYEYGVAIATAVLIMFLFSSAETIWGPVRFSRFLVIPLTLSLYAYPGGKQTWWKSPIFLGILFLGLFATQLAYAWYTAAVFFA